MPENNNENFIHVQSPDSYKKDWGVERWIVNNNHYCAKILDFAPNSKFSLHFHSVKHETWYVQNGFFTLVYIDTLRGKRKEIQFGIGDVIIIPQNVPHQLISGPKGGRIFEVSTPHFEDDSYRIEPGGKN